MKIAIVSFPLLVAVLAVTCGVGSVGAQTTTGVIMDVPIDPTLTRMAEPVNASPTNVMQGGSTTTNTYSAPTVVTPPAPVGLPSVRILSEAESMLLEQQALIACAVGRGVFLETRISHPLLPNGGASIRTCRPAQEAIRLFEEQVEVIRKQQR
jgi:hypothetical protein